jgi:outer membrane immunogenic protein
VSNSPSPFDTAISDGACHCCVCRLIANHHDLPIFKSAPEVGPFLQPALSGQWLLYGTGGLAYGQTKASFTTTDLTIGCIPGGSLCANGSSSSVRTGWTAGAGAGAEAMLAPNWSVKVEYLYVDLGGRSVSAPAFTLPIAFSTSTPFREQIVRVGLNYHFDWAGPVVARY